MSLLTKREKAKLDKCEAKRCSGCPLWTACRIPAKLKRINKSGGK